MANLKDQSQEIDGASAQISTHYQETLGEFSLALMVLGGSLVVWVLSFYGSLDRSGIIASVAGILLIGGGYGVRRLREAHFQVAWYLISVSLVLAIGMFSFAFPTSPASFFYPVAILISSLLVYRIGIIGVTGLAIVVHLIVALLVGAQNISQDWVSAPLAIILGTAVAAWIASRQLREALESAETFSGQTREMLIEIRQHRVELNRTIMALEQAKQRLEELNDELDEARQEAEEANRFKSEFLAHMSHELRTPLNAIINFTAFVSDGVMGDINPEQIDTLQKVMDSGNHLLSLINDILDISKIESGMMSLFIEEVDMNPILMSTVSMAKALVKGKPIRLKTAIEDDLPSICGDKRRLRQIFLNLVSNAVKFTPEGSVTIIASKHDGELHASVRDSGIGIAPEDQESIFEAFKQAPHDLRDVVGTGLGLPICKHFVEAHGGRIWLESEPGAGSTFYVVLPVDYLREQQDTQMDSPLGAD
jgi:signal transduction histidine kinase